MMNQIPNLKDRRALVTGAAGNLGKVFADTLASLGSDLVLVDKEFEKLSLIGKELKKQYQIDVQIVACDLESLESRENLIKSVAQYHDKLNILVNNAAFVGDSKLEGWGVPFEEQTVETWRRALEVNLTAAFHLCKGFTPLMRLSKGASIINIASIYAKHAPDWRLYENTDMSNPAAYGASKAGLIQLTKWLATTIAPEVRVNAISPGGIFRKQPEIFVSRYINKTPLARMATEDDFRGPLTFLASDMSQYVTGHVLEVDGGWCCT